MNRIICGFLFIILFFLFPNQLVAQKQIINIKGKNIRLKEVFDRLEDQSGFSIAYNRTKLDDSQRISPDIENLTLDKALYVLFKGTDWSYCITGKHIVIVSSNQDFQSISLETPLQNIRGIVLDGSSGLPIPYSSVFIQDKNFQGAITDSLGFFRLTGLPVGRYDIQVLSVGYEATIFREIMLTSSKEVYLEIPLKEKIYDLDEVVVRNEIDKGQPLNRSSVASGRMFSMEEASRYAGGFDDPARLVTSFAGVSGGISDNSVSIRGNAPHLLQWKLEDIEIPNPNHFADLTTTGGGVFTALSSQVLGNSDFFTGAFPAEYGNALSGVFDMKLRNGNNKHYEHTIQTGLIGLDIGSEGPLKKGKPGSYLFNYRYSTLSLIKQIIPKFDVTSLDFQDLSFKINLPVPDAGTFSIWGIGLVDKSNDDFENSSQNWGYDPKMDIRGNQYMGAGGIGHKYFCKSGASLKTTLGLTFSENDLQTDSMDYRLGLSPSLNLQNRTLNLTFASSFNYKFSKKHSNKTGINATTMFYDFDFRERIGEGIINPQAFSLEKGNTALLSAYSNSTVDFSQNITASFGLNTQVFTLNGNWTVEPRLGIKWHLDSKHSLALSYGLHSKIERLATYFVKIDRTSKDFVNRNLDFIKSNQWVLGYTYKISENTQLKIEPYFQYLFDVPIVPGTIFSSLNGLPFFVNVPFVNDGKGKNSGIDFTLERFLKKGYYYLFTGSVFDSKYSGDDGKWHDTRYNSRFTINLLGGKEWMLGKFHQNVLGVNLKFTFQGGERFTPVDEVMSQKSKSLVYDANNPYSQRFPIRFISNLSANYRINRSKISHEFAIKIINLTGSEEYVRHNYNYTINKVEVEKTKIILPNISYKIEF